MGVRNARIMDGEGVQGLGEYSGWTPKCTRGPQIAHYSVASGMLQLRGTSLRQRLP